MTPLADGPPLNPIVVVQFYARGRHHRQCCPPAYMSEGASVELSEFISKTISDIVTGINDAHDKVEAMGATICPANVYPENAKYSGTGVVGYIRPDADLQRAVHSVEFDVAISLEEGKETKGGIGISIAHIGLGAQGKSDASKGSVSRIKFTIPLAYPER